MNHQSYEPPKFSATNVLCRTRDTIAVYDYMKNRKIELHNMNF